MCELITVTVEMPGINIDCPHCGHEETHYRLWTDSDEINGNEGDQGKTYCDKCEKWFRVHIDF